MAVITGSSGADTLSGTSSADEISGLGGADVLSGRGGNDTLFGGTGGDSLSGGAGADSLVGGAGIDTLDGGGRNDTYLIDASDVLADSGGIDRVHAAFSYTLLSGFEKLTLLGASAINGTGNSAANILRGNDAANQLSGLGGEDTLRGAGGDDTLLGGNGNDSLRGGTGADSLVGGAGVDTLNGGGGNDTYVIDASDVLGDSGGIDTVRANFSYTLLSGFENLFLTGTSAIDGTGNDAANTIRGNGAANRLSGSEGADTLQGGAGHDTLLGGIGADLLTGGDGSDSLVGGDDSDTLSGGGGNDTLNAGGGNDTLNGGTGTDSLVGESGNDTYVVDSALDVVSESSGAGTDHVQSSVTIAGLAANVENLTLTGSGAINGTGNDLANTITGNGAANVLNGGGGGDILNGAGGNDTYVIDASDVLIDSGGIDTVQAAFSYMLLSDFENLTLLGGSAIDGTGNGLANIITGNSGANSLNGGGGVDTLNGNSGADTLDGGSGADVLMGGGDDDVLIHDTADTSVQGGTGTDTLKLNGSGVTLDLTGVGDTVHQDLEVIDLTGTGNNSLIAALSDVLAISTTTNTLRVAGNAGDAVTATGAWALEQYVVIGAQTYAEYTNGAATLQVDSDIDRSGITLASINLRALDGTIGFRIDGTEGLSGNFVASAGDVNGDGFDDMLIGANLASPGGRQFAGATYVVFGKADGFASSFDLASLDGTNGFVLNGIDALDFSGVPSASAGDVNGDGFDDLIIGASLANGGAGESYVVFGKASGFASSIELSALDGTSGFVLNGIDPDDHGGHSVASAGDVNGDGFDDLIVGAYLADPGGQSEVGESYVVFGKASGLASSIELSALDGTNGFVLNGVISGGGSGQWVDSAGDVNGDGFDDLIVGASNAFAGVSYIVFGKASGFASSIDLSALDGTSGFRLNGVAAGDQSGQPVAAAGDVNGDGFGDLIIGAYRADPGGDSDAGETYVVFGKASGFASSLDLSALDGTNGFRIDGIDAGDWSGFSAASAGDVNGDGFDDLVIGALYAAGGGDSEAGESYLVFGKASGFASSIDLASLDGTNGFMLVGTNEGDTCSRVAGAGDVNGDGFDDLIIGAREADPGGNTSAGESYVVFGGDFTGAVTFLGTSGADTLTGTSNAESFVSGLGNDTIESGGGADVIRAGEGNDVIRLPDLVFADIDGGSGIDKLALQGGGHTLDLTTLSNSRITGIEVINLTGSGDNTLTLSKLDLLDLSGTTNVLRVCGDVGDAVSTADNGWLLMQTVVIGSQSYAQYINGAAVLQVDIDIDRSEIGTATSAFAFSGLTGANGFRLDGIDADDFSGWSVASAGDVNGDGFDDLIIGAPRADGDFGYYGGESYVVFGKALDFAFSIDLAALDGTNGFRLDGGSQDYAGVSVAAAGDVNGDGLDDLIIGAGTASHDGDFQAGESYVVFGNASGFTSSMSLSTLDGTNGFRLDGIDQLDRSGHSVAAAGDVNGDGFDDVIVGAYFADLGGDLVVGESYVVFGDSSGFASSMNLSTLDGTNGFRLDGIDEGDHSGWSVAEAGDVNDDGFDDLIVGAPGAGESYVVFGNASGFTSSMSLSTLDGTNGFRLDRSNGGAFSGGSVATAGDVNGDGFDDLIIGARRADQGGDAYAGESYVVFGKASGFASSIDLATLDGTNGFRLDGIDADDQSGWSVATAGDVNGDGFDDLIIGARGGAPGGDTQAGESYVVFGKASGFASSFDLATLDGNNGFRLDGIDEGDQSGFSVAGAGDVNGDGFDDLIIGARYADPDGNTQAGESYVVFGGDFTSAVTHLGTSGGDTLSGTVSAEGFVSGQGNDTIIGGGGADVFRAGEGNDVIRVPSLDFADVDGGSGSDKLALLGAGQTLDLTGVADSKLTGIEVIGLTGSGDNTLTLSKLDLLALSDSSNVLRVCGDAGDTVTAAGSWNYTQNVVIGAHTYAEYTNGAATLRVDVDIDRSGTTVSSMSLGVLDGTNGFRLAGVATSDSSGFSVSDAGDVNGDGFDDLIVGAFRAEPNGSYSGASYVVFGKALGFASNLDLSALDGASGFRLDGAAAHDYSGRSVSTAGDVNGDGFGDLIIGADFADPNGIASGASYVVFGKASGFASSINLSTLDGTSGFRLEGVAQGDVLGRAVSGAGDVNGDGFDDLIIGATYADLNGNNNSGASYVVFGRASGFASSINLSILDGTSGFRLDGEVAYDRSGLSVAAAGDVNGDGFGDLIVGAAKADPNGTNSGASYVVFGKASGFASSTNLSTLDGTSGFRLEGADLYDHSGVSVAAAGDVNGDGFGDLVIGAHYAEPNGTHSGASYVVFGKASGFASTINLSALDGTSGFRLEGVAAYDRSGRSVSEAGDVNGDGFGDLIVGAYRADPNGNNDSGANYVVFGKASGFASSINLSTLDGTTGFRLDGADLYDLSGFSVSAAGDVNGDGFGDLIVGAYRADPNGSGSGASYIVFGGDFTGAVTFLGTSGADSLTGTAAAERFVSEQGNDTITSGGGADVVRAGEGEDLIEVSDTTFADIDGGSGTDTLAFLGSGHTLHLTTLANSKLTGVETIDITGSGDNTLELSALDLLDLSDTMNELTVDGNGGDAVDLVGTWSGPVVEGDYMSYTSGTAKILIDADILVS